MICSASCQLIELDWHAGNSAGYIENEKLEVIYTSDPEFNEFACLSIEEVQRLAKWAKRNCK